MNQRRTLLNTGIDYTVDPKLLSELIFDSWLRTFKRFVFISPHFDDAVLSCGSLLEKLRQNHKEILVVTVFTRETQPPFTPQATAFVKASGYKDPQRLFLDRQKEDIKALSILGVKFIHFPYIDAGWRKSFWYTRFQRQRWFWRLFPQFIHIYPYARTQFAGRVCYQDHELAQTIAIKLRRVISNKFDHQTAVFVPLGIGGHVDHVLVRSMSKKLDSPIIYWEDFPYNTNDVSIQAFFAKTNDFTRLFEISAGTGTKKYKAIKAYRSQLKVLFPNKEIPKQPERYYVSTDITSLRNSLATLEAE